MAGWWEKMQEPIAPQLSNLRKLLHCILVKRSVAVGRHVQNQVAVVRFHP